MAFRIIVLPVVALAVSAAAKVPETSWGRAGVSLAEYLADAITCGRLGANADIADQPATAAFIAAERFNERNLNVSQSGVDPVREQALMLHRLQPAKKLAEVQNFHLSATERCLTKLGYQRFSLTRDQSRTLRRLGAGTPARHAFLHGLASDADVLTKQALLPISRNPD